MVAVEVCIDSFAGWEKLIMNESASAPPNTEHELLLEAGRFFHGTFSPRVTHTFHLLLFVEKIHFSSEVTR